MTHQNLETVLSRLKVRPEALITIGTLIAVEDIYCIREKSFTGGGALKLKEMLFGWSMLSHITIMVQMFLFVCGAYIFFSQIKTGVIIRKPEIYVSN